MDKQKIKKLWRQGNQIKLFRKKSKQNKLKLKQKKQ